MIETEFIRCKTCRHEFEAFANDLATYQCPECFERTKKPSGMRKVLDDFMEKMRVNEKPAEKILVYSKEIIEDAITHGLITKAEDGTLYYMGARVLEMKRLSE